MNRFINKKFRKSLFKILAFTLLISFIFSPLGIPVNKASAALVGVPVAEVAYSPLFTSAIAYKSKEFSLDGIAWAVARTLIQTIVRSTINWINTGFKGNPAYVSNPQAFFAGIADAAIGEVIASSDFGFLCSQFRPFIITAIYANYSFKRRAECTVSQIYNNLTSAFDGSFEQGGGWGGWYQLSAQTQNNPYGAYEVAQLKVDARIAQLLGLKQQELQWGKGFLSWRECSGGAAENQPYPENASYGQSEANCNIVTPGSFIENRLGTVLTTDIRELELSREIDQLIGALLSQLAQQLFSQTGLFGLSRQSPDFNNNSYTEALFNEQQNSLNGSQGQIANLIDINLRVEQDYIAAKQLTLNRIILSENLLNSNLICDGTAQSTINTQITPLKTRIINNISEANQNTTELENLQSDLGLSSIGNFDSLYSQYLELSARVEDVGSVSLAQTEFTQTSNLLATLDQQTQQKIDQCQAPSSGSTNSTI